jgi:hypothetical protein
MLDLLTQEELEIIQQDFRDILEDPQYKADILYRRLASQALNLATGVAVRTITDTEIETTTATLSLKEIGNSNGLLQVGDVFFMFDPAKLPVYPAPDDQILKEITDCGHLHLVNGSAAVVGYNTSFKELGVQGGDVVVAEGVTVPILSVTSDTALTLKSNWTTTVATAVEFNIYRVYEIVQHIIDPLKAACRINARRAGA